MKNLYFLFFSLLFASTLCSAIPKDEHTSKKIIDKKLSDKDHGDGDSHNPDYDHDAFLGREDAKEFEELTPDESKERLGEIYVKIDKNNDNYVDESELREWIKHVQRRYAFSETDRQWKDFENSLTNGLISWETYKKQNYDEDDDHEIEDEDEDSTAKMIKKDEKRWRKADVDSDGLLSKEEFMHFLHPEETEHMRDVVVDETLEDIDKDGDGRISLDEYINDLWPESDREGEKEEPDWVRDERDQFTNSRDKNKDGFMDREEVRDWIIPEDYDHSDSEAKHLMEEADANDDGKLTKEEVIAKYDVFVGSQATDFGEALTRHDEF